jgi:hypothetical protein
MSLINDALKRAQEAQRQTTSSSLASFRSVEVRPEERPRAGRLLAIVVIILLSGAFAFIGLAMTGRLAKRNGTGPQVAPPSQPVAAATPVAAVVPVVPSQPALAASTPTPAPVPAPAPAPKPVVEATVVVPPPPLVLPDTLHVQGIAYDPVRPWAIISGRTVYVGEMVKGVRVMAITRNSVTFGSNGQTNLLYVGQ